jgi:hypothetical protein
MTIQKKKDSTTVLLKVYDNDTEFTRCNYAIVEITKDLLETVSKLRKGRDELKCYETTEFNYSCEFLAQDEFEDEHISDELIEALETLTEDNAGVWQIESFGDVETLRTDADTIHVSDFGFKFEAYGKHSGVEFTTEKIPFDIIDSLDSKNKKCSNCDGMELHLDEICSECGREA